MNKSWRIFLDMDGVIADFNDGAHRAHGRPNAYIDNPKAYGIWDIEKVWGISAAEFWKPIMTPGFWLGLNPTPEASDIVRTAIETVGLDNVAILTSPNQDPNCILEKEQWVEKHFPELARSMIFARSYVKRHMAHGLAILIDDYDRNTKQWEVAGGPAILVPRPWNSAYKRAAYTANAVALQLIAITSS